MTLHTTSAGKPTKSAVIGHVLLFLGLGLSLLIVFGAIPPLNRLGIWLQSEPVVLLRLYATGLTALALTLLLASRFRDLWPCFAHPILLVICGWALWQLIVLPFSRLPSIAIFGSPELGEGILSQLCLLVLVAAFLYARRFPAARVCLGIAALIVITITVFVTLSESPRWMPFYFKDFLAFYGIYFWLIAATWLGRDHAFVWLGALLGGAAIVIASDNRTAWVAAFLALGIYMAVIFFRQKLGESRTRRLAATAVAALPVAITGGVVFITRIDLGLDWSRSMMMTVTSRSILIDVVWQGIKTNPLTAIFGAGWGHFTEYLLAYVPDIRTVSIDLHPHGQGYFWDATWRGDFHSHNGFVEAALAGGLPGLLFALALIAVVPLAANARNFSMACAFAAYLGALQTAWFEMPTSLPFLAMALAGVGRESSAAQDSEPTRRWSTVLGGVVTVVLLAAATISLRLAIEGRRQAELNVSSASIPESQICDGILDDHGRGPSHFSWLLRQQVDVLATRAREGKPIEPWLVARVQCYLAAADRRAKSDSSLRLSIDRVIARADIAFAPLPADASAFRSATLAGWGDALDATLSKVPRRTDLFAPYFFWLLKIGEESEILARSTKLLERNPADAVALWFSGIVLLKEQQTQQLGLQRMREALSRGIERVFPVDQGLKAQILGHRPNLP